MTKRHKGLTAEEREDRRVLRLLREVKYDAPKPDRHRTTEAERQQARARAMAKYKQLYKRQGPAKSEIEGPAGVEDFQPYQLRTGGWLGDGCRWSGAFHVTDMHWFWGHGD